MHLWMTDLIKALITLKTSLWFFSSMNRHMFMRLLFYENFDHIEITNMGFPPYEFSCFRNYGFSAV